MLKTLPLHILLALAEGDSHGYGIMQAIRRMSGGDVPVQTASFYRHLGRLIDEGLVAEVTGRREGGDARRGVSYRITPRGRRELLAERRRLASLVAQMDRMRLAPRKAGA